VLPDKGLTLEVFSTHDTAIESHPRNPHAAGWAGHSMTTQPNSPRVSIIIPSWTGKVDRLRQSIEQQTFRDYEVDVVQGVSPAARARNIGAARARGEILVFVDDDAYFGHPRVLELLIAALTRDPQIAVAGSSKLAPRAATPLQRKIARQVPRTIYPVVRADSESNPPLDQYGFTAISTTCCAVRRAVYEEVGGFDEQLTTGPEDTDFFYRIRRQGYRLFVAGNTWVYHDPPASVRDLLRKSFWYGLGHALEARKNPERGMAVLPLNRWYGVIMLVLALLAFPASFFVHFYFDPARRIVIGFRPLKTLSTYAVLCGYVYGWYHGPPRKPATTYMGRAARPAAPAQPVRVLYIDAYPGIGGGQHVLLALVTRLPAGYTPVVALPPASPLHARLAAVGVRSVALDFQDSNYTMPDFMKPLSVLLTARSMVRVMWRIVELARREKIDLIHANSAVVGVHALPAAAWLRLPCIVHAHDFNTAPLTNRLLTWLMHYRKSAMIFVSYALAQHYSANRRRYFQRVVHNGIDGATFHPDRTARAKLLADLGLPDECFLIGAVGRLEWWKGFDLVIQAFATVAAQHPQARLIVVGDVVFDHLRGVKDDLVRLSRQLGLADKVIFTGFRSDVPQILAGIDLLVHCPRDQEAFSMVLIEALACARPIVTVASGGSVEQVFDGVNGFLVPVSDVPALAAATGRMVAEPEMARRMGQAGLRIFHDSLTIEHFAANIERFYDDVLARNVPHATPEAPSRRHVQAGDVVGNPV
jgi:glycosyltransferase involved in cell wall biosynthesis